MNKRNAELDETTPVPCTQSWKAKCNPEIHKRCPQRPKQLLKA